jgi:hypothetical protein
LIGEGSDELCVYGLSGFLIFKLAGIDDEAGLYQVVKFTEWLCGIGNLFLAEYREFLRFPRLIIDWAISVRSAFQRVKLNM